MTHKHTPLPWTNQGRLILKDLSVVASLVKNSAGYFQVNLYNGKGLSERKPTLIHQIVAKAFISNPKKYPFINHIDGNRTNNVVENLEWCNHAENMRNAVSRKAYNQKGDKNSNKILSSKDVIKIRESRHLSVAELAEIYGVSKSTIYDIYAKRSWENV